MELPPKAPVHEYLAAPGSAPFRGPTLAVGVGPALEIASCKICYPATTIVASVWICIWFVATSAQGTGAKASPAVSA